MHGRARGGVRRSRRMAAFLALARHCVWQGLPRCADGTARRRRGVQALGHAATCARADGRAADHASWRRFVCARRRLRARPRRLRSIDIPPRRAADQGADDADRSGRCRDRAEERNQHGSGEEPGRQLRAAVQRAVGLLVPRNLAGAALVERHRRDYQAWPGDRCRVDPRIGRRRHANLGAGRFVATPCLPACGRRHGRPVECQPLREVAATRGRFRTLAEPASRWPTALCFMARRSQSTWQSR